MSNDLELANQEIDQLIANQFNNLNLIQQMRKANRQELEKTSNELTEKFETRMQEMETKIKNEVYSYVDEQMEKIKAFADEQIEEVRKIVPLSDGEATQLKSAISSRATITTSVWLNRKFGSKDYGGQELFSKKYGHIIRAFYGLVKKQFDAIKYTTILHANIEEAIKYANSLNIRSLNSKTLRITESQLKTINQWEKDRNLPLTPSDN